jgi:hypothetical protein
VAVAVGRSYADVPPNRGVYRGGAEEKIHVSVSIQSLSDESTSAPAVRPQLEAHVLADRAVLERRLDANALEQQRQQQQQQQQQQ